MTTSPWRRSAPRWRRHLTDAAPDTLAALAEALDAFWETEVSDSERAAAFACSWRHAGGCGAVIERWSVDGTCERLAALGYRSAGPWAISALTEPDNYVVPPGRLKLFSVHPTLPDTLPPGETMRLYRGVAGDDDHGLWDGISWTSHLHNAHRYASRAAMETGRTPKVWTAIVPTAALLLKLGDPSGWSSPVYTEYVVDTRVEFEAESVPIFRP